MQVQEFISRRLLLLTGKGGTGKTRVSAALALASAKKGRRVLVAEVDSQRSALAETFGCELSYEPTQVADNVWACNITFKQALVDWLDHTIRAAKIVGLIIKNPMVQVFLEVTPGAREMVVLSRICSYMDEFDQVVVDLPASGHAVSLLRTPDTAQRLMRTGPIHERATELQEILQGPDTALGIVALPEEMVVNETVELFGKLKKALPGLSVPLVFLNRCAAPTMTDDEHKLLARLSVQENLTEEASELLLAGRWDAELERATAESLGRLHSEIGVTVVPFPRLGILGGFEGGPSKVTVQMAGALNRRSMAEAREGKQS
ncbi:MAG: ArsA family ATPase [Myxococcota bacterium]